MEVIIVRNRYLGPSCIERNGSFTCSYSWKFYPPCGFLSSLRPLFGVPLNMKSGRKMGNFSLRIEAMSREESDNRLFGGGFLEKEFEFKPSFDEVLKAMESVKSGRAKKKTDKTKGHKLKDDFLDRKTPLKEREEKDMELKKFKGIMDGKKMPKIRENNGLGENGDRISGQVDNVNGEIDKKERGHQVSRSKLGVKEEITANVKNNQGGATRNSQLLNDRISVMNPEFGDFIVDKSKKTQSPKEINMISDVYTGSYRITDIKDTAHGKNSSKMSQRKKNLLEGEEVGLGGNKVNGEVVTYDTQLQENTGKEILWTNGLISRSSQSFLENNDDEDDVVQVERAAFRNFEELNDVATKPRVSKREREERIQKLAKCLNGADIDMPEWMFSKTMRSARIKYTEHAILRVMQILGKYGNWQRVLQLIEWLQIRERFKSNKLRYVYTTALDVLGKARRPVEALNLFHTMQQRICTYPDLVAYHSIAVTLGQAGHMKELFDVIDSMRALPKKKLKGGVLDKWDPRLEPDIVVYNAVLNACVKRKQWEGAFWVLQQLKQQGQQPSTATYGLVMEVMLVCGKYNLVHEFFRKVQKSSLPNALAYRVLVNTLWREGKVDEALLAVQDMEKRGIVGSAALYSDLARCLCSAGRCEEALRQIEKICKVASKPLVVTYTGLIQACLDAGSIQNAIYIFHQMIHFCSPNLVTCNIMLKAYLEHGLFEEAKELFHKMLEGSKSENKVRIIPDIYTFNTMLDACVAEERWDDFEYVYGRMLRHGYHFNAKRHLRMILDASRAGKGQVVEITWKHLSQADRDCPPPLIKERFCIMLEKDDYDSALAVINTNAIGNLQAFSKKAWFNLLEENGHRLRKDTLIQLMHELRVLLARSNSSDPVVLQNLLTSCADFLRTLVVPEINTVEPKTALACK